MAGKKLPTRFQDLRVKYKMVATNPKVDAYKAIYGKVGKDITR